MSAPVIRKAVKQDCPRLLELIKGLAEYEQAPEEVTISVSHLEDSGFGKQPVWWAYVVEVNGMIQGFALYYIRFSTWKGQRMYLEDIYIEPEMRGKGLGKLLFEQLITEAKEKKLNGMVWQALEWNKPALNFYKKYNARFDSEWINISLDF